MIGRCRLDQGVLGRDLLEGSTRDVCPFVNGPSSAWAAPHRSRPSRDLPAFEGGAIREFPQGGWFFIARGPTHFSRKGLLAAGQNRRRSFAPCRLRYMRDKALKPAVMVTVPMAEDQSPLSRSGSMPRQAVKISVSGSLACSQNRAGTAPVRARLCVDSKCSENRTPFGPAREASEFKLWRMPTDMLDRAHRVGRFGHELVKYRNRPTTRTDSEFHHRRP